MADRQLELLRPLGIDDRRVEFVLPEDRTAEASMQAFVAAQGLTRGFVVVNPAAGWDSRLWPTERYARVVRQLDTEAGLPSCGDLVGLSEVAWAEAIVAQSGGAARLAPATTLRKLAALLHRACLYVGSDTGPTHLAAAVGTPCVAMFGTTRPEVSGPYGSSHRYVQEYYQQGSSRERRRAANEAMQAIAWERVYEACQQVLATRGALSAAAPWPEPFAGK